MILFFSTVEKESPLHNLLFVCRVTFKVEEATQIDQSVKLVEKQ